MQRKPTAVVLALVAAGALTVTGCDRGGGLRFAPQACILAKPSDVQSATGNSGLASQGNKDTDFGGSVCTYKDADGVTWRFSDVPVTSDTEVAKLREQLQDDGYALREPTKDQAALAAHDNTLVVYKGDALRGVMTTYQDITIVVQGPSGTTLDQAVKLRAIVWDGFTAQAAAAVAGQ